MGCSVLVRNINIPKGIKENFEITGEEWEENQMN
jgi:hypothetical protein